jgi:hypothetical protein
MSEIPKTRRICRNEKRGVSPGPNPAASFAGATSSRSLRFAVREKCSPGRACRSRGKGFVGASGSLARDCGAGPVAGSSSGNPGPAGISSGHPQAGVSAGARGQARPRRRVKYIRLPGEGGKTRPGAAAGRGFPAGPRRFAGRAGTPVSRRERARTGISEKSD